jgi:hypothetical protein
MFCVGANMAHRCRETWSAKLGKCGKKVVAWIEPSFDSAGD